MRYLSLQFDFTYYLRSKMNDCYADKADKALIKQ